MGDSRVLTSDYLGNWVEDFCLTESNHDYLDIYSNAISRYKNELDIDKFETKEVNNKEPELQYFSLPNFNPNFDLVNGKKYSKKIQNWKGVVTNLEEETFTARLIDLTFGGTDEIVEFELNDISPDDMNLLDIGAVFYWSVGHYMENGQSVKRSDVRFQRLILLDEEDIESTKLNIELKYSKLKERKIDDQ
ncbi:MAG: hypothetical protein RSE15_07065 [Flavobacterium sp.]|uniref:hypothetical protein n=1 Tax=Flavobacterium sp. TaxID=239 RepID=UPI002B4779D4|nr:hypothetical protein [Flavobacterium sp.]WRH72127.1 MAG: hypothetical protein RSE15_07065 [Flavobacterium sp.]